MKRYASILWPTLLLLIVGSCGKEKAPRYTTVPIIGYPYPFGVSVKNLLGKSRWTVTSSECPTLYSNYHLGGSLWSEYSQVVLTADSLGTLQAFSAIRPFSNEADARAYLSDLSEEMWRRYGSQTDSTQVKKTVLSRTWRDQSGNMVSVNVEGDGVKVKASSGRIEHDCPGILDTDPQPEPRRSG